MKNTWRKTSALVCALAMSAVPMNFGSMAVNADPGESDYTLIIPATLDVKNAGWNAIEGGITASGTLEDGKKLVVTAASDNAWNLVANKGEETESKVGYNLAKAEGVYNATAEVPTWEFNTLGADAVSQDAGIIVEDYSEKPAGMYQDVVTFTASVENAAVPATGITLNKSSLLLMTDGTNKEKLVATVEPSNTTDAVTWESSDTSIATVDNEGNVTAVGTGSAKITAKAGDFTASCSVAVDMITIRNADYSIKTDVRTGSLPNFTTNDGLINVSFVNTDWCGNDGGQDGWYFYGNGSTVTVEAAEALTDNGYSIDKVTFYTKNGSGTLTSAPFTVYSYLYNIYTQPDRGGQCLNDWGVNKIEVYLKKQAPGGGDETGD